MTQYNFYGRIGRGGFGVVHEAERAADGWPCAAKVLRRGASQRDRRRFDREVRLQSKLSHKNIVPIVGMNLDDDPPWFIMPLAEENLRDYLDRTRPGEERLWVFDHAARGLEHAHEEGVLHRDVKPENVLLFEDESGGVFAALGDFGLGRLRARDTTPLTVPHTQLGTIAYAAPEQWADAATADERADVYALGKLLFEVLTGVMPYPDSAMDMSLVAPGFAYIIEKATEQPADQRFPSVSALLVEVAHVREATDDLHTPSERANVLTQTAMAAGRFGASGIGPLVKHLVANLDDVELLTQVVPRLPQPVLDGMLRHHATSFRRVLRAYDEEVSSSLPFSYCDVVADFYGTLFELTTDREVRRIVLSRLPRLGYDHNRFHVGDVFARLVTQLKDPSLIMHVRDVLASDPDAASWCSDYLRGQRSVATAIRQVAGLGTNDAESAEG